MQFKRIAAKALCMSLLVCVVGVFLDSYPQYQRFCKNKIALQVMQSRLATLQQSLITSSSSVPVSNQKVIHKNNVRQLNPPLLSQLSTLSGAMGVTIMGVKKSVTKRSSNADMITLIVTGSQRQLLQFLYVLSQPTSGLLLHDYSIETKQGVLLLEVGVSNLRAGAPFDSPTLAVLIEQSRQLGVENIFCVADHYSLMSDQERVKQVALSNMQLLGYVSHGNDKLAWVRLPDGHMLAVTVGEIIGLEHARVSDIQPDKVVVVSKDGVLFTITNAALNQQSANVFAGPIPDFKLAPARRCKDKHDAP